MNKVKENEDSWVRDKNGTAGYRINPVKGKCPRACVYCYARAMYDRFKWNPEVKFDRKDLDFAENRKEEHTAFFVGSTMELFGPWIKPKWMEEIMDTVRKCSQHRFIFLTKCPENLRYNQFPPNCVVGASVDRYEALFRTLDTLRDIRAVVKFISFEPLLESMDGLDLSGIDWVTIGAQSNPTILPKRVWVTDIEHAANNAGTLVFMGKSLKPTLGYGYTLRQEIPR